MDYNSLNTSNSRLSYISNLHHFIDDSLMYNRRNIDNMMRNLRDRTSEESDNNSNDNDNSLNPYDVFDDLSLFSNNHNSILKLEEESFGFQSKMTKHLGRAATAPARPYNAVEEFKSSAQFTYLEKAGIINVFNYFQLCFVIV